MEKHLPLYARGRQPVVFPARCIIHVDRPDRLRKGLERTREDLEAARYLPQDSAAVEAYLSRAVPWYQVAIRSRRPRSVSLFLRAIRAYQTCDMVRAWRLVEKALDATLADNSLMFLDVVRGAQYDMHECAPAEIQPGTVHAIWTNQKDWWTGGDWPNYHLIERTVAALDQELIRKMHESE